MQEGLAEHLRRQVQPRRADANDAETVGRLQRRFARRRTIQVDRARQRPIVEAGGLPAHLDRAVGHRKRARLTAQPLGRRRQQQGAHFRAGCADRPSGHLGGHRAHRQPFVGDLAGRGRRDPDTRQRQVQFLGGHLGERGADPLAIFHAAEGDPDDPARLEAHPATEPWIGGEHRRNHARASSRIRRAARATASITRLCTPQRQRCQSSASAISARLGSGLLSSRALALTRMPERQ